MKRDEALRSLSRDHHQALVVAQRLRREPEAGGTREAFLEFWHGHGAAHFRIEEDVLLPEWSAAAGSVDEERVARMLLDHVWIRAAAQRLERGELSEKEVLELGERLAAHVRLEEREIFPAIEQALDAEQLAALARVVEAAEARIGAEPGA